MAKKARQTRAVLDVETGLAAALDEYEMDVGRYPTTEEGLQALTLSGPFVGTVIYAAPEQVKPDGKKRQVDARTDVYYLAVVLYEAGGPVRWQSRTAGFHRRSSWTGAAFAFAALRFGPTLCL